MVVIWKDEFADDWVRACLVKAGLVCRFGESGCVCRLYEAGLVCRFSGAVWWSGLVERLCVPVLAQNRYTKAAST